MVKGILKEKIMKTKDLDPLTERQEQILMFCADYLTKKDRFPPIRSICKFMNINSTNGVHEHLKAIVNKKYLRWGEACVRFTDYGWQYTEVVSMFGSMAKNDYRKNNGTKNNDLNSRRR